MKSTRRDFVKELSLGLTASVFAQVQPADRLPMAFSTLGCPGWDLAKILSFAQQHGFAAIEFRGLQGSLDLPSHPAFASDRVGKTKRDISSHGLRIACVSSSTSLHESDPRKRAQQLADARRFVDLAATLGAPYIRVFGNSDTARPAVPSEDLKARVAAGLHELGDYAGPRKVTVLLESHDDFTSSATLGEVLRRSDSPHVGLLWDAFHTFVSSNEDPQVTVGQIGRWIRHTHLKDGVGAGADRKYVLTGQGNVPIKRQIEVLHASGYKGFYCFEWEKVWHPELADPEIAIADYARVVGGYLRELL
jgi:sugar phosphate isomerase/epimerase